MSIGVHCEECGKTYQVSEKMAGRRGKCPSGHPVVVPEIEPATEENAFSFANEPAEPERGPAPKTARRRPAKVAVESQPAAEAADDFAFPTQVAGATSREPDEAPEEEEKPRPKTGRHKAPERKPGRAATGKPSLVPLILGSVIGAIGLGAGITMFVMARGEAGPLRDKAETAEKKAAAADEKARNAESAKILADAEVEKLKKAPAKDPGLEKQLQEARKRANDAEAKLRTAEAQKGKDPSPEGVAIKPAKEPDPDSPGGKNDPVMPGGKLAGPNGPKKGMEMEKPAAKGKANAPEMGANGGKNWSSQPSASFGQFNFTAGDRITLTPAEDTIYKPAGGRLATKFKWQAVPGKEVPAKATAILLIVDGMTIRLSPFPVTLSGMGGDVDANFDVAMVQTKGPVTAFLFVGEGDIRKPMIHSTLLALQAEFPQEKK